MPGRLLLVMSIKKNTNFTFYVIVVFLCHIILWINQIISYDMFRMFICVLCYLLCAISDKIIKFIIFCSCYCVPSR